MKAQDEDNSGQRGLYEKAVQKITYWVKPHLHHTSEKFVSRSVAHYAPDNPRFARMIEFEIRRRGDGAGLTQDVAEPLLWTGIKTAAALAIATATHSVQNKGFKMIGYATALGLVLNNAVELARLKPRYVAGLQGSLEMAKDRWHSIEETGVDPFNQQNREINLPPGEKPGFVHKVQKRTPGAAHKADGATDHGRE